MIKHSLFTSVLCTVLSTAITINVPLDYTREELAMAFDKSNTFNASKDLLIEKVDKALITGTIEEEKVLSNLDPSEFIQVPANPANYSSTTRDKVEFIVIHQPGVHPNPQWAASTAAYFQGNPTQGKASAHFTVDEKGIYQCVPENKAAFGVGDPKALDIDQTGGAKFSGVCTNSNSISIEVCATKDADYVNGIPSEGAQDNAARLTKYLMDKYNVSIDHVIRHFDVSGKHCGEWWWNHDDDWQKWKSRLTNKKTTSQPTKTGNEVVDYALQFVGNPYVWSGTDLEHGCDCSGFVMRVFEHFGVSLPRTSEMQGTVGEIVDPNDIQPGDAICYGGHIAIYIGDNKIVHASNSQPYPAGGIKVSEPWNYRSVVSIRRYL